MIDLLFIIFLISFLAYHYTSTNIECNTAASTYLQIWTGACGMSCRHSGYSRFSGMSGLNQPARPPVENAPSSRCVCEACPCAFIENVLRRCQPATDICEQRMEVISVYMADIMRVVNEVYGSLSNTLEHQRTSQRQAELVSRKETFESNQNLTFDREKTERKANESKIRLSKSDKKLSRSDVILKRGATEAPTAHTTPSPAVSTSVSLPPATSSDPAPSALKSDREISFSPSTTPSTTSAPRPPSPTLEPPASSQITASSCLKCIADQKTCNHYCPKSSK